ncbi:MAG: putative ATP-binding protein involved in virulence [Phenylobacterium sp.]|jgi:predicted ATP-binding protein involved in virulence
MKIHKIDIENFKLFSAQEFTFHPEFNLLVGVNGSGKTSLLRAIAVALGGWAHAYFKNDDNLRPILDEEIREIQIDRRFDKSKSTTISATGEARVIDRNGDGKNATVNWIRQRRQGSDATKISSMVQYGSYPQKYPISFDEQGSDILNYIESGRLFNLPVIAFYECDRLWLAKQKLDIEASASKRYSRFDPYKDCFHTGADHHAIGEWLLKQELAFLQKKQQSAVLLAIKNAAIAALEDCVDLTFDFDESRVMVEFENDVIVPFEHLSDGQRIMLGLFCDIARRAAILNPHIKEDINASVSGIVLIDELDLHLHPKWQRLVIENLRRTFPKIQFICTTHSAFLIQSLRDSEELIMLGGEPLADYANKGIEEITKNMGVSRPDVSMRYEDQKEAAKSYLQLLDQAALSPKDKQEEYKRLLAEKIAPFAGNPAYQAFLELKYATKMGE